MEILDLGFLRMQLLGMHVKLCSYIQLCTCTIEFLVLVVWIKQTDDLGLKNICDQSKRPAACRCLDIFRESLDHAQRKDRCLRSLTDERILQVPAHTERVADVVLHPSDCMHECACMCSITSKTRFNLHKQDALIRSGACCS